jgi:hypothetical protein
MPVRCKCLDGTCKIGWEVVDGGRYSKHSAEGTKKENHLKDFAHRHRTIVNSRRQTKSILN